jgi:hypothetical protein
MSGDPLPTSTAIPASADPVLTSVSLAAYASTTFDVPRPASMTLDVARHHAFTGEITFASEPAVRVYLDGGVVYHAERDGELTVSQALLDGNVIDVRQLERGMVRVGDVEHLGRLFERDTTIDRDSVMVVVERHTDLVVSELARSAVAPVTISAYRHHPSGLHRWFVAPIETSGHSARPISEVAQVDRSVVDEIPDLGRSTEGIRIEWNEPDPSGLGLPMATHRASANPSDADVQAELDRFDADHADWAMAPSSVFGPPNETALASPLGEFHIVWPDGTAEDALAVTESALDTPVVNVGLDADLTGSTSIVEPLTPELVESDADSSVPETPVLVAGGETGDDPNESLAWPIVVHPAATSISPTPVVPHVPLAEDPHPAASAMPVFEDRVSELPAFQDPVREVFADDVFPLAPSAVAEPVFVEQLPAPDAAVPDDVAAAVRRALQAIDEASLRRDAIPHARLTAKLPRLAMPTFAASFAEPVVVPAAIEPTPPPIPPPVGFAPPTLDMRVEAIYAREIDAQGSAVVDEERSDDDDFHMVPEASPREAGRASVVFVDEESTDAADSTERRGALRRLIKSLRSGND